MKYGILKAVEHEKLAAAMKRAYPTPQAMVDGGWWVQPKYDGVFGMACISAKGTHSMLSRTNEVIRSCDHILQALYETAQAQSGGWDDFVVLGELWHPGLPFPSISGDVRRHSPSPHLRFMMNDLLPPGLTTPAPYWSRLGNLHQLYEARPAHVECIEAVNNVTPPTGIEDFARYLVACGGYDGAILRDADAGYIIAEAKAGQIVKVKPTLSLALRVVEFTETVGKKTGRAVYTVAVEYRGVRTEVGAGMPHDFASVPALASIIEVECLGITADGKLREPRYKGIRHDVLEPDT